MVSQWEIEDINGEVVSIFGVSRDQSYVLARLDDNQLINVPIQLLEVQNSQRYYLPRRFRDFQETTTTQSSEKVFPVIEEKPLISKKKVDTAEIKIKKQVSQREEVVEQSLAREEINIDRIPKNDVFERPAQMRVEGDCTYIPVQEEILVVEKRYLVREEICIKKIRTEHNEKVIVKLKKEDLNIERKKMN